jgi:hypothetical protein
MPSFRRVFICLPLAVAGSALWSQPSASQDRAAEGEAVPLLRAVARMSCGTPRPRTYRGGTPGLRSNGAGSMAAQNNVLTQSAELVGTLELSFGAEPRRGTADAERPLAGSWTAPQIGYCTGGRGPLHLAVITPAADGRPARFELRGPASYIRRPGAERAMAEGGEVRFTGTCGRRQEVVMEIWPPTPVDAGQEHAEPDRFFLVGTVTCAVTARVGPVDTTPTATP